MRIFLLISQQKRRQKKRETRQFRQPHSVTLGRWPTDKLLIFKHEKLEMIGGALFKDQSKLEPKIFL